MVEENQKEMDESLSIKLPAYGTTFRKIGENEFVADRLGDFYFDGTKIKKLKTMELVCFSSLHKAHHVEVMELADI